MEAPVIIGELYDSTALNNLVIIKKHHGPVTTNSISLFTVT